MADETTGTNFIRTRIDADRAAGRWGGKVATRFPPEPNGYLHIGHAKSICLNFGLARDYDGTCNLRFDDTNPVAEDPEFVEGILADVRWLGFEPTDVLHASDYFETLYGWAEDLIGKGLAYVDDTPMEQMREMRGTVTSAGTPAPGRDRSPAETLDLFRRMRAGEFPDGSMVLRAKIDLGHANMKMRDPLMYRIKHVPHHRTGDAWCIYPMYDWAHGQSDAIEGITHSICTLEFENNRELYDWFVAALELPEPPNQIEFARLNLTYTVMSKRFLRRLVEEGRVEGWDDPRMPTIAGLRRRGVPPEAVVSFAERVGVAKANSTVDVGLLDHAIREVLDRTAPRRMAVVDPLEVELVGWAHDRVEILEIDDFPPDVGKPGSRGVPFTPKLWIDRSDFSESPPPGWRRLVHGGEVRLAGAYVVRCERVERGDDGEVCKLWCSVDEATLNAKPVGRRVKGTIHWVSASLGLPTTFKLYDRLFGVSDPGARTGEYLDDLNPDSLVVAQGFVEPSVAEGAVGDRYQLVRTGYAYRAPEDADEGLVLTRIVPLKDGFKTEAAAEPEAAAPEVVDPMANAVDQARLKAEARADWFADHADAHATFDRLVGADAGEDEAWTVVTSPELSALLAGAEAEAGTASVVNWLANTLVAETKSRGLADLPFDGAAFGRLVALVDGGTLNAKLGKQVLEVLLAEGGDPKAIATERGWIQQSDADALGALVDEVLAGLPDEVARYQGGETKLLSFFMGQVMKASQGKANPGVVRPLLQDKLG